MLDTVEKIRKFEMELKKKKNVTFEEELKLGKALFLLEVGFYDL